MKGMLLSNWQYRNFVLSSLRGELRGRFARSRLGAFWFILHPLAQAAIFALVLAEVLGAKIPGIANKAGYAVYVMAGMAAWGLFAEILNRSMTVFLDYAGMLKKLAFPRLCLPIIIWGGALINHVLLLAAIAVVFAFFGYYPGLSWLALPFGLILISTFAFGIGVLLGVFNVFSRDVAQVTTIVLQLWFWLTPIVYPLEAIPKDFRWVVEINPMTPLVQIYQNALLHDQWPQSPPLVIPALLATTLLVTAFTVFRRASSEMVDAL